MKSNDEIREAVQKRYAAIAESSAGSCCSDSCCQSGYTTEELSSVPREAFMGLGCGNPVGLAEIDDADTVVDLGSGGGIDVFLAAQRVGPRGHVIGVDMTREMLETANANADRLGFENVEFRHGMIEALPIEDSSVDVILSNCVINLAPDKSAVFAEAFRVLKPGGRLVVSDMVSKEALSSEFRQDLDRWASCLAGAIPEPEYLETIREAGFSTVDVLTRGGPDNGPVYSVTVRAVKSELPDV